MALLDKVLDLLMKRIVAKHGYSLENAVNKVNNGGDFSDIDTIVRDYYGLLRHVHKGAAPRAVTLMPGDRFSLVVDGITYDFDELIPHRDQRSTGRKMEIEVLFSDEKFGPVIEERLNALIRDNW